MLTINWGSIWKKIIVKSFGKFHGRTKNTSFFASSCISSLFNCCLYCLFASLFFLRDDALKINYKNVQKTNAYNFHKQTDSDPFGVKYDFCSIMHYGNTGLVLLLLLLLLPLRSVMGIWSRVARAQSNLSRISRNYLLSHVPLPGFSDFNLCLPLNLLFRCANAPL